MNDEKILRPQIFGLEPASLPEYKFKRDDYVQSYLIDRLSDKELKEKFDVFNTFKVRRNFNILSIKQYRIETLNLNRDKVIELYTSKQKTKEELWEMFDSTQSILNKFLTDNGIQIVHKKPLNVPFTKEDLIDAYINQNNSLDDTAKYLHTTKTKTEKALSYWQVYKPKELVNKIKSKKQKQFYKSVDTKARFKHEKSLLKERYGVINQSQLAISREKLSKYNSTLTKEEWIENSIIHRLGHYKKFYTKVDEDKLHTLASDDELSKLVNENYANIHDLHDYFENNVPIKTIQKRLHDLLTSNLINHDNAFYKEHLLLMSSQERIVYDAIKREFPDWELTIHRKDCLFGKFEIDIFNEDMNLGFEVNPEYTHSLNFVDSYKRSHKKNALGLDYHIDKTIAAEQHGIHLIHIFPDMISDTEKLISSIHNVLDNKIEYIIEDGHKYVNHNIYSTMQVSNSNTIIGEKYMYYDCDKNTAFITNNDKKIIDLAKKKLIINTSGVFEIR